MAGSGKAHLRAGGTQVIRVENLVVEFPSGRGKVVHAVSDVSFDVLEGETLGIVGESGCGKSTTGRAVMQLPRPTSGSVVFDGVEMTTLSGSELRKTRSSLQMIFQDPISSLNPRRRVRDIVSEGLSIWKTNEHDANGKVDQILMEVGLDPEAVGDRRPHQFSGGQCQRICIARAVMLSPRVIICDEPVSALDVSVQAQILNLLRDLKAKFGLTMMFIADDLAVVKNISDRVMVMYLGKICEVAGSDDLYAQPLHPYTRILLDSIPDPDPSVPIPSTTIVGDLPSPLAPPSGCRFRTRCPNVTPICSKIEPEIREHSPGHFVACHNPGPLATASSD